MRRNLDAKDYVHKEKGSGFNSLWCDFVYYV